MAIICSEVFVVAFITLPEYAVQLGVLLPRTQPLYRCRAVRRLGARLMLSARTLTPWQMFASMS